MKRIQVLWFLLLFFVCNNVALAQLSKNAANHPDSLLLQTRTQLQQAVNKWNEQQMLQTRAMFERLLTSSEKPWLVHYYIALTDLYLSQYYMKEKDQAEKYVDEGIAHLNQSIELKKDFADAYALLANLYGMKISFAPVQGMILGPRSNDALKTAEELEPDNPRVHLIAGTSALHTPKVFGGGRDKAIRRLKKAAELFLTYQPPSPVYPDWGHENTYAWLGKIAIEQDSLELAEKYLNKALEINPDYSRVKLVLLPQLKQEKQKKEGVKTQ